MNDLMNFLRKEQFLILPGGGDIDPSIYGKKNYKSHVYSHSIYQDEREMKAYEDALKAGRPVFGICRGMQLAAAINGLTLIQDMDHPGRHDITIRNIEEGTEDTAMVNSLHHQLVWTENKLDTDDFTVYGHCLLSDVHHYQIDESVKCRVEPEIIYFPKTNTMGVQFHPEMMYEGKAYAKILDYVLNLVKTKMI